MCANSGGAIGPRIVAEIKNMGWGDQGAVGFAAACKAEGVLCNAEGGKNRVRLVTHLDVPHARAGDVIARLKRAAAR